MGRQTEGEGKWGETGKKKGEREACGKYHGQSGVTWENKGKGAEERDIKKLVVINVTGFDSIM